MGNKIIYFNNDIDLFYSDDEYIDEYEWDNDWQDENGDI